MTNPPTPPSDDRITAARATPQRAGEPLLEVADLRVHFPLPSGPVHAVNGAHLTLHAGETLAVVGESGAGKSITAQAIMGLVRPPAVVTAQTLRFRDIDLLTLSREHRRRLRGTRLAMIFQDASTALHPLYPVGWQIAEPLRVHAGMRRAPARARAIELMERVGITDPATRVRAYPHQLSGGMRQRVMIAMALALTPDILIADEPTSALDVTVQAQVLDLLQDLQREQQMGLLLVTHDLGVVAQTADRVAVMYGGRVVESGPTEQVLRSPAHPYTEGLLGSIPTLGERVERLRPIPGAPPSAAALPDGCAFHPRCDYRTAACLLHDPPRYDLATGSAIDPQTPDDPRRRSSACHHHPEVGHGR